MSAEAARVGRGTRAIETLDCASKVRIHYQLPAALSAPLLERLRGELRDATLNIQTFSRFVAGASDHATLSLPDVFHAAGALGARTLVATFGKPRGERPQIAIDRFERGLEALALGPIARAASSSKP